MADVVRVAVNGLGSAMDSALAGMQAGAGRVHDAAKTLATEVSAEAIVDMKSGERQHEANAKVVKAVDDMLGDLIDTLA